MGQVLLTRAEKCIDAMMGALPTEQADGLEKSVENSSTRKQKTRRKKELSFFSRRLTLAAPVAIKQGSPWHSAQCSFRAPRHVPAPIAAKRGQPPRPLRPLNTGHRPAIGPPLPFPPRTLRALASGPSAPATKPTSTRAAVHCSATPSWLSPCNTTTCSAQSPSFVPITLETRLMRTGPDACARWAL